MKQNRVMNESFSPLGSPRPASPRISPIKKLTPELQEIMGGGINSPAGTPLNIFGTIAHHPRLLKRFMNFAGLFLNKGLLPAREREIVILRVGWNCQSVYEFGQHTIIGQRVGLSLSEIDALTKKFEANTWSNRDAALIAMADDLCSDNCVSEATWNLLTADWKEDELIELVMVAGTYRLVSGFLNTMGVELDADTPGWPEQ
jgi:4-carboxymuconolactone decarboxylase